MAKVEIVYFGTIDAMVNEVSAYQMPSGWIKKYKFRFCTMALGDAQFETEYFCTKKDAKECAVEIARFHNVKTSFVG